MERGLKGVYSAEVEGDLELAHYFYLVKHAEIMILQWIHMLMHLLQMDVQISLLIFKKCHLKKYPSAIGS